MTEAEEWSQAFAVQAWADWQAYSVLSRTEGLPPCQSLHFLQMTCEKLCKAYEYRSGTYSGRTAASHVVIAHNLPLIFRVYYSETFGKRLSRYSPILDKLRGLAREIELLAPASDAGARRPDNCEYPWRIVREWWLFLRCMTFQWQISLILLPGERC
ncbi:MAG: hypothetical protein M3Y13_07175 [Armatimonadota bacterium]|nr:hypothetical protein [Armatimonadota bacterium]